MNPFDPSQMDPQVLMRLSRLVQELPPDQLNRMQTLMHNMMAGFDVRKEMEEFERTLPPGFREQVTQLMAAQGMPMGMGPMSGGGSAAPSESRITGLAPEESPGPQDMNLREARLTLLRAVHEGRMSPEEAERLLFPES